MSEDSSSLLLMKVRGSPLKQHQCREEVIQAAVFGLFPFSIRRMSPRTLMVSTVHQGAQIPSWSHSPTPASLSLSPSRDGLSLENGQLGSTECEQVSKSGLLMRMC